MTYMTRQQVSPAAAGEGAASATVGERISRLVEMLIGGFHLRRDLNHGVITDDTSYRAARRMHRLLYFYNGLVVLLLVSFMSLTQHKVVQSMLARSFLEKTAALPQSPGETFAGAMVSFAGLAFLGWLYRREKITLAYGRYVLLTMEIGACMLLMRMLNLSYDGVVLLVVADLMHRYEGHHQEYILLGAMAVLYLIANYNLAVYQMQVIPFEVYVSYYAAPAQGVLTAVKNVFSSLNIILFVFYLVMLVKSQSEEKERIRLLNERLEEANQRLRVYAIEAEQMAETRERNRLAREIHDTLGHALTGIIAGLDACMMIIDTAPDVAKNQLDKIYSAAKKGMVDVRRSMKKLRPDDLEKLPFQEALSQMTKDYAASSGMEISFRVLHWPHKLREDQEDVIYRVVQESLTNANRHGEARHVTVTVDSGSGTLHIVVADDGKGCAAVKPGFGLRHMQERLELLHGSLDYRNADGFIIEVAIPLNREEAEDDQRNDRR